MGRPVRDCTVVVTGASSGIGRATALAFAREGAAVVPVARREGPLQELAEECERVGGWAVPVPTDVTDEDAVTALARAAVETFGRIDVWGNNAAVHLFGRLEDTPLEDYRRVLETNVLGYVAGARAVLPWFREQGSGVLVNVGSMLSKVGAPLMSAYVVSKFGVRGLSDCLRTEVLDAPGIAVCTVLPAAIDTPLFPHAGNYTGRRPVPPPPVYDPDLVAEAIVDCARRPRREVYVGASA